MEIHNVQRTGNMHYIYLPTSWCREHNITSKSKVSIEQSGEGSLVLSPQIVERKPKHLKISLQECDDEVIPKLIVACYINPAGSFEINLDKELEPAKLLNQKQIISLESVEIDKKQITCEGGILISDPESLLKTMLRKIRNMVVIMHKSYDKELISRYEDEIDRSKMLIDKSIINSLAFERSTKLKTIDLYYTSLISKDLERMADHLIKVPSSESEFLSQVLEAVDNLYGVIADTALLEHKRGIQFIKKLSKIKKSEIKDIKTYDKERVRRILLGVSEVIMDWAITNELRS